LIFIIAAKSGDFGLLIIARCLATKQSHGNVHEIAALPSVARNDSYIDDLFFYQQSWGRLMNSCLPRTSGFRQIYRWDLRASRAGFDHN